MRQLFFHEESIHEVSRRYLEPPYIHTHTRTSRNQYFPHFFKVGGITMGQNDLTFWSMFANSLFNRQKNMFVFIFISQISYRQMEFTVLNWEQKFIQ